MQRLFEVTIICSLLLAVGSPSVAQEVPQRLDSIVVTGARIGTPLIDTPANISVITKDDIEESGIRSLPELFKGEPGVFPTSIINNPKQSTVDIRGYGETAPQNVLFLIDGRRVNSIDLSGPDLAQIPIDMIERVEIYRGPATVLFGDNAVAGAINIILKKGEGKPAVTAGVTGGSYNFFNPRASVSGSVGKFSFLALGSYYDTLGYRQNNTLRMKDIGGTFSYQPTDNLAINLKTGLHSDSYGLPGALSAFDLNSGRYSRTASKTPDDSATTEDNYVDLGADITLVDGVLFSLYGSYRDRHTSSNFVSFLFDSRRQIETYSFNPKLSVTRSVVGLKNTLVTGFDYYEYPTTSSDSGAFSDSSTRIDKTDYGFYINDELYILKNLILSAGYRWSRAKYAIDYVDNLGFLLPIEGTVNYNNNAFRASANYLIGESGNVFATYAQGYRLPTTEEFFNVFAFPPINERLKPQTTREIDVGARYNFTKNIAASLTLFANKNEDELYFNPLTFETENYERTKRQGLEAGLYLNLTQAVKLNFLYSYTEAKLDAGPFDGNYIPFVPRNKFSGKITYLWEGFTFALTGTYVGPQYLISDFENRFPQLGGYTTFDFTINYTYKNLQAVFTATNLTGKEYYATGVVSNFTSTRNFYPAAQQWYYLGLQYKL